MCINTDVYWFTGVGLCSSVLDPFGLWKQLKNSGWINVVNVFCLCNYVHLSARQKNFSHLFSSHGQSKSQHNSGALSQNVSRKLQKKRGIFISDLSFDSWKRSHWCQKVWGNSLGDGSTSMVRDLIPNWLVNVCCDVFRFSASAIQSTRTPPFLVFLEFFINETTVCGGWYFPWLSQQGKLENV